MNSVVLLTWETLKVWRAFPSSADNKSQSTVTIVKEFFVQQYGITVNYSRRRHNYCSAWKYVTKSDNSYIKIDITQICREGYYGQWKIKYLRRRNSRKQWGDT